MGPDPRESFTVPAAGARDPALAQQYAEAQREGICIFCPEHRREKMKGKVHWEGKHWFVIDCTPPRPGMRVHLLVIPHQHRQFLSQFTSEEWEEFGEHLKRIEVEFQLRSAAVMARFGYGAHNGAGVQHVHFHVTEGDVRAPEMKNGKPQDFRHKVFDMSVLRAARAFGRGDEEDSHLIPLYDELTHWIVATAENRAGATQSLGYGYRMAVWNGEAVGRPNDAFVLLHMGDPAIEELLQRELEADSSNELESEEVILVAPDTPVIGLAYVLQYIYGPRETVSRCVNHREAGTAVGDLALIAVVVEGRDPNKRPEEESALYQEPKYQDMVVYTRDRRLADKLRDRFGSNRELDTPAIYSFRIDGDPQATIDALAVEFADWR